MHSVGFDSLTRTHVRLVSGQLTDRTHNQSNQLDTPPQYKLQDPIHAWVRRPVGGRGFAISPPSFHRNPTCVSRTWVAGAVVSQAFCLRSDVSSQVAFSVPDASNHPDRPRARRPTSSRWVSTCDSPVLGRPKICCSAASPQQLRRVRSKMDSHAIAATKSLERRSDSSSVVSSSGCLVYRIAK